MDSMDRSSIYTLPEEIEYRRNIIRAVDAYILPRLAQPEHRDLIIDYLINPRAGNVRTIQRRVFGGHHGHDVEEEDDGEDPLSDSRLYYIRTGEYDQYGKRLPGTYDVKHIIDTDTGRPTHSMASTSAMTDFNDKYPLYIMRGSDTVGFYSRESRQHSKKYIITESYEQYYYLSGQLNRVVQYLPNRTVVTYYKRPRYNRNARGINPVTGYEIREPMPRVYKHAVIVLNKPRVKTRITEKDVLFAVQWDRYGGSYNMDKRDAVRKFNNHINDRLGRFV